MNPRRDPKADSTILPLATGYENVASTLCLGLDIAWHGGSKNDRSSQFDFVVAAVISPASTKADVECVRVRLTNRDPDALLTIAAIQKLIRSHERKVGRVVLAVDAPIQADPSAPAPLKKRAFRQCERHFNRCRKSLDKAAGGASGWHPNVQAGVPLAPRVKYLVAALRETCAMVPWTQDQAKAVRLIVECFPAEAIWAAKRLDQFPERLTAPLVKAYKEQGGSRLSATQVRELVETTLLDGFKRPSGVPHLWPRLVEEILSWMLVDQNWQTAGLFRGGKLLDDVVDSCICLATAISYASNNAHAWQHPEHPDDGHIIGPGRFDGGLS